MSFLSPLAFWWSLLLLPLVAFYFLKVRPEKHKTALLFLWDKVFRERKSSALFKRFRNWLSLLLLLLAFCAIIFALAQPYFSGREWQRNFILIIDNSASMGSSEGKITRLQLARDKAAEIVHNLLPSQRAIIVSIAADARIKVGVSSNHRELLEGIDNIKQSSETFNVSALKFLKQRKDFFKNSRALLLTDGCFASVRNLKEFEILKIGEPANNAGICSFDIIRLKDKAQSAGIFLRCASTYKNKIKVDAVLCHENRENIVKVIPLELVPGENKAQTFYLEDAPAGKWILYLDRKDALDIDNTAYGIVRDIQPVRVGVSNDDRIYNLAVASFSQNGGIMTLVNDSPEVTVLSEKAKAKSSKLIIFNPRGKSAFWKSTGKKDFPGLVKIKTKGHPAVRFANLDMLEVDGIRDIVPPENALIIAETVDKKALIYKTIIKEKSAYVINFDPLKANFFLNVNFPVLLCSMVMDLVGREEVLPSVYRTGTKVDGKILERVGFYKFGDKQLAAALLSSSETLIDNSKVKSTAKAIESGIPLSWYLFAFALLLLILEEILYNYRKVG
jgi:von Willebrand factor type A domain/Aerotolerance regulator N-terminal